ncbi:hypothetical protein [Haploplasma axanthum]|uniref:Uncharacterized protein n=1 Tax=Haploplasma axanthum TaxID=29552 RepID=A0A449BDI4_HAPAX|nr:hypothetical protein [Haploplasma axanthum]VEU80523.1 Uncharacterised protein [Haploplasma axanthum]
MKKVLITMLLLVVGLVLYTTEVSASEADLRGFDIDGFSYVADHTSNIEELWGAKHYYGKMNMWTSIYKVYIPDEDKMFYAVLVEAMIDASTEKNASRSFSSMQIGLNVKFDSRYARLVTYTPKYENSSYTVSISIGTQHIYIPNLGIVTLPTITQTLTEEFKEIALYSSEEDNGILMNFDFTRYADNKRGTPYQGAYRQQATIYFSVDNYSVNFPRLSNSKIAINYTPLIFKDAAWFEKNAIYDYVTHTHQYNYSSNGNFNKVTS